MNGYGPVAEIRGSDSLIVRRAVGEKRILGNNLFAIATYTQRNIAGATLGVSLALCDGMDAIVLQLSDMCEIAFLISADHQLAHLCQYLDLF